MKKIREAFMKLVYAICVSLLATLAVAQSGSTAHARADRFGGLPLAFEPNRGQVDGQVKFLSHGLGPTISFGPGKVVIGPNGRNSLTLSFRNSKASPVIEGVDQLPGNTNYFFGRDSSKWITQIPTFATVKYVSVYPGVDVRFHGHGGQLEYDFDVAPGSDPRKIRIEFDPSARLHLDGSGDIVIGKNGAELCQHPPRAYQEINGVRREVVAHAVITNGREVSFVLARYDHRERLVIDPVLVYSTYLGGSGGVGIASSDYPVAVATDSAGNTYLAGSAASPDFPVTAGAFQTKKPDSPDSPSAFVAKLSPDGSTLIYSTFLGGTRTDTAVGIAIDTVGNAYVSGNSTSTDFPLVKPFQSKNNDKGSCAFVAELNATGSALLYSSYLGGSGSEAAGRIALDAQNNAWIAGATTSVDFPVTALAAQPTYGGGNSDGFVAKVSASGSLAYATYLGGSFDDAAGSIAVDANGNAYAAGYTASSNFPHTAGVVQPSLSVGNCNSNPCHDAFVTKLDTSGSIVYSTFLGGTGDDFADAIGLDASGDAYLTGLTTSTDFPLQSPFETYPGGFGDKNAFVAKLNAGATALVFSTYFGNAANGKALAVDSSGDVFFAGTLTGSGSSVPLVSPLQSTFSGVGMFLSEFDPTGQSLLFSTYFAGDYFETPYGIAVDSSGNLTLVGETGSSEFPVYRALQGICPLGVNGSNCPDHSEFTPGTGFVSKFNTGTGKALVFVPHSPLTFSTTPVGGSSPGPGILLLSMGTDPVTINSITSSTPDFTPSVTCVGSLGGGQQCQVAINFTPQQTLTRTATLTINDDDVTSPQQVSLTGFSTGFGVVSLSTNSLTFPSQPVGATESLPITVTNIGTGVVTFTGFPIMQQNPSDGFSQTNNCPVQPATLAIGAICTINLSFTPERTGGISGAFLEVTSDAVLSPTVTLRGTATGTAIGLGVPAGDPTSQTVMVTLQLGERHAQRTSPPSTRSSRHSVGVSTPSSLKSTAPGSCCTRRI